MRQYHYTDAEPRFVQKIKFYMWCNFHCHRQLQKFTSHKIFWLYSYYGITVTACNLRVITGGINYPLKEEFNGYKGSIEVGTWADCLEYVCASRKCVLVRVALVCV